MLRIVIVDDEINIVEGLKKTVEWEEHGCQVVGTAYDGTAAWDVVCEKEPDILITDITMPGMDGIKLVEKLRPRFPAMRFIYLTCNDDFEMARSAFRTGACDYIVKETMTREELYESIEKAEKEIANYRENMLNKAVVSNELKILPYGLDFEKNRYLMGLLFVLPLYGEDEDGPADRLKQIIVSFPDCFLFRRSDYEYVVMMKGQEGKERQLISELYGQISRTFDKEQTLTYFYAGLKPCRKDNISRLYENLRQLRSQRFYRKHRMFLLEESGDEEHFENGTDQGGFLKHCEDCIRELDTEKSGQWVRDFLKEVSGKRERPESVLETGEQVLVLLLHEAMRVNASVPNVMTCLQRKRIYQVCSIYELEQLLCWMLADGITQIRECVYSGRDEVLTNALRYIEENLGEHLSLGCVARHVSMNASYFSRYFKGKMGENFVDYLVRQRMDRAKQKLKYTGLSVEAIAAEVGYSNITYFNDSFKKYTGQTPGAYRRQEKKM